MGIDWKDAASWGLAGMPKQVFESDGFKKGTSWIGKAIPNEITTGKYANLMQSIPILNWISSGISATDMAATAYDDTGSASKAWEGGTAGTFGKNRNPGAYNTGGERENWDSHDAFQGMVGNQVGGIGNFAGRIFGGKTGWGDKVSMVTGPIDEAIQPSKSNPVIEREQAENGTTGQSTTKSGSASSPSTLSKEDKIYRLALAKYFGGSGIEENPYLMGMLLAQQQTDNSPQDENDLMGEIMDIMQGLDFSQSEGSTTIAQPDIMPQARTERPIMSGGITWSPDINTYDLNARTYQPTY